VDQSILGCGLPEAEQSSQAPLEFENSILDGGSSWKLGPRRCASKLCPPADVTTAVTPERRREARVVIREDDAWSRDLPRARVLVVGE